MPNFPNVDKDNDYLMARYDNSVIDAKNADLFIYDYEKLKFSVGDEGSSVMSLSQVEKDSLVNTGIYNPFGFGHMLNHPPEGVKPNVFLYAYDFNADLPVELRKYVPNRFFKSPTIFYPYEGLCKTMVCIAIRPIKAGDELFLDYRYNPNSGKMLPEWYHPVDLEENKRRWAHV